jgi:hypothetical protein
MRTTLIFFYFNMISSVWNINTGKYFKSFDYHRIINTPNSLQQVGEPFSVAEAMICLLGCTRSVECSVAYLSGSNRGECFLYKTLSSYFHVSDLAADNNGLVYIFKGTL